MSLNLLHSQRTLKAPIDPNVKSIDDTSNFDDFSELDANAEGKQKRGMMANNNNTGHELSRETMK